MAGRVIAQMIIQGASILGRAVITAYSQALHNAKAGGGAQAVIRKVKMMPDEAMKILNIEKSALNKESIESQYKKFYHSNDPAKGGSFYLQSKIYRARESLEHELNGDNKSNDNINNDNNSNNDNSKTNNDTQQSNSKDTSK